MRSSGTQGGNTALVAAVLARDRAEAGAHEGHLPTQAATAHSEFDGIPTQGGAVLVDFARGLYHSSRVTANQRFTAIFVRMTTAWSPLPHGHSKFLQSSS